jgi:hypothetical protein
MSASHAAPITTITTGDVLSESLGLMKQRREDAQRIFSREVLAGASKEEALAKAGPMIRAGHLALIKHRAEMAYAAA